MATLTFDGKRFLFRCSFAERDLAKSAGFKWREDLKWYTENPVTAAKLRDYATEQVRLELSQYLIEVSPWLLPLPHPPEGLTLFPHQIEAIQFVLERNRCYLGLDPGLGKTIVAAMVAEALCRPVVYVSPPFLVQNVEEEFQRWAPSVYLLTVPDSKLYTRAGSFEDGKDQVFLKNDPILIVDEAHRFKNPDAKRTKAIFQMAKLFKRQIWMSGTPMPNRPMELFTLLSKVAPETIDFKNQWDYGRHYCAGFQGPHGWDFSGASNLGELRRSVIHPDGPFMLRQKKELLNLPPKMEEVFVVSADMSPRLAKLDRTLGESYANVDDLIKHQLALKENKHPEELHTATYRRLLGQEKVKPVAAYLESILEETDENVLVFAFHKDVIAALAEELKKHEPMVITGDTSTSKRHAMVVEFQKPTGPRLLIGNYLAMGVGFTLTRATRGVFLEFSYVPGENEQAGDRMHRIGQTGSVLIQYVVYKDSLDKKIIETILRKRKAINFI